MPGVPVGEAGEEKAWQSSGQCNGELEPMGNLAGGAGEFIGSPVRGAQELALTLPLAHPNTA